VTGLGEFSPIGRLFTFGQWFENNISGANLWDTFFHGTSYLMILTKNGWAMYILGVFFINASGHPDYIYNVAPERLHKNLH
jgi:hypothetical protein